jgi:hypothetical protein
MRKNRTTIAYRKREFLPSVVLWHSNQENWKHAIL